MWDIVDSAGITTWVTAVSHMHNAHNAHKNNIKIVYNHI